MSTQTTTTPESMNKDFNINADKKEWQAFNNAIHALVDEARIESDGNGSFTVKCVDPAYVAMMNVTGPATGAGCFIIDTDKQKAFIQKTKGTSTLHASGDEGVYEDGEGVKRRFKAEDSPNIPVPKVPNHNLPDRAFVDQAALLRVLKHCEDVSDHIALQTDSHGNLTVSTDDDDKDQVEKTFNDAADGHKNEGSRSLYSLDYFHNIVKSAEGTIEINLGTDCPVRLKWSCGPFDFTALLAPRLEVE